MSELENNKKRILWMAANCLYSINEYKLGSSVRGIMKSIEENESHKDGTLYKAIQDAANELPDGYTIRIEIEHGSAIVELSGSDCDWTLIDGNDGYLCQAVTEALEIAKQRDEK